MTDHPLRGFVILVVEDDPDTLNAVAYLISEAFGCRVLRASSVDYALRMIDLPNWCVVGGQTCRSFWLPVGRMSSMNRSEPGGSPC